MDAPPMLLRIFQLNDREQGKFIDEWCDYMIDHHDEISFQSFKENFEKLINPYERRSSFEVIK
jgi:hypothetical protein